MGNNSVEEAGLSRRDLLKRSAVAGAVVWTGPTVLASAAGAQTSSTSCPSGSCPTLHVVKLENEERPIPTTNSGSDVVCSAFSDVSSGSAQCTFDTSSYTVVATTCAQFNMHVDLIENNIPGFSGNSIRITLADDYQFVQGFSKKGGPVGGKQCPGDQGSSFTIDPNSSCRVATFAANSHIEFSYCGPS